MVHLHGAVSSYNYLLKLTSFANAGCPVVWNQGDFYFLVVSCVRDDMVIALKGLDPTIHDWYSPAKL